MDDAFCSGRTCRCHGGLLGLCFSLCDSASLRQIVLLFLCHLQQTLKLNILLDTSARPVIGHRGNRAHAPENTLESFAQAVAAGADAIEFDVRISLDGVPVVIHDPSVLRTTLAAGEIASMTFAELRELDTGAYFTPDSGATFPYR